MVQRSLPTPITEAELVKLVAITFETYPLTQSGVLTQAFLALYPRKVPTGQGR